MRAYIIFSESGLHSYFPRHYRYLRKVGLEVLMIELKLLTGCGTSMKTTARICAAIAGITAIDERKYSEPSIT